MTEWISVKDRFPEIDGYGFDDGEGISDPVLVFYTCTNDDQRANEKYRFKGIAHWYVQKEKNKWTLCEPLLWDCLPVAHEDLLNVTHWMPLPETPNEL